MLPKSLPQSCFESPCLGATEGMKPGARDERVRTLLQGCTCSIGSPVFDPWFNSEDTPAEVLEIPCSLLPVCCHLGIVWMSSKPRQLQPGHLCSGTATLLVARKWLFIYLPVTFSTGLFYVISVIPAVQISPHYVAFPPRCWWVSSPLPWCCWQVTEFTKCFSQQLLPPAETSSAPHRAAPPQSSIQPLNTREISILRLDVSPSSLNNNPAWAQMSCQAGWWCCFKFTIIYFSNLISKMEMHISAHDFQLISYFLSAFQCCWNALCYRQNTLIMMGLFFQQLPLSNVTHRENGKLTLPSCVKHLKRREEKELVVKRRW